MDGTSYGTSYHAALPKDAKIGRRGAAKCQHIRIFVAEKAGAGSRQHEPEATAGPMNGNTYYYIYKPNQ